MIVDGFGDGGVFERAVIKGVGVMGRELLLFV
jgi:hypothetical protein